VSSLLLKTSKISGKGNTANCLDVRRRWTASGTIVQALTVN
jgi:hypothetical protein